jgi:hypothetical protein
MCMWPSKGLLWKSNVIMSVIDICSFVGFSCYSLLVYCPEVMAPNIQMFCFNVNVEIHLWGSHVSACCFFCLVVFLSCLSSLLCLAASSSAFSALVHWHSLDTSSFAT